jgi:hypothetical protein
MVSRWRAARQPECRQAWASHLQSNAERSWIGRENVTLQALREKEQELITALGGDPSPQEQAIIADSVKNMLHIASLDHYLMQLKSIVRKGRPHPVLSTRTQFYAHLRDNLKALGLQRRVKAQSLQDILSQGDDEQ